MARDAAELGNLIESGKMLPSVVTPIHKKYWIVVEYFVVNGAFHDHSFVNSLFEE